MRAKKTYSFIYHPSLISDDVHVYTHYFNLSDLFTVANILAVDICNILISKLLIIIKIAKV